MFKRFFITPLLTAFLALPSFAQSINVPENIITFTEVPGNYSSHKELGFTFISIANNQTIIAVGDVSILNEGDTPPSAAPSNGFGFGDLLMTKDDDTEFTIDSIDLVEAFGPNPNFTFEMTGIKADSSTVTFSATLDGQPGSETFPVTGFVNLKSIRFGSGNTSVVPAIDNIVIGTNPTPTPTPEPTATPEQTTSPVPTLPASEIKGRIANAKGTPAPEVVVYLYKEENVADIVASGKEAPGTEGALTKITDDTGEYHFKGLIQGFYRIIPDLYGLSFAPVQVFTKNGTYASDIEASIVLFKDQACTKKELAQKFVESDGNALKLRDFVLSLAKKNSSRAPRQLVKALENAGQNSKRVFTNLLNDSRLLPKTTLSCGTQTEPACSAENYRKTFKNYRRSLATLRRLAFFILRKTREATGRNIDAPTRQALKLHKAAVKSSGALPKESVICPIHIPN